MKIKGEDIVVLVYDDNTSKWVARAYGTTCELDITVEYIRAGNPSSGRCPKKKPKLIDWKVTCGNLLSSYGDDYFNETVTGKEVAIMFTTVESHPEKMQGIPEYTPTGVFQVSGNAIITRYTTTSQNKNYVTASVTFDGSGELKKT